MFDKILIWVWILLGSILVIENVVSWYNAYLFLDTWASSWIVILVWIIIWIWIWFGIKWILWQKKEDEWEDEYDF